MSNKMKVQNEQMTSFELQAFQVNLLLSTYTKDPNFLNVLDVQQRIQRLWGMSETQSEKMACINIAAMLPDSFSHELLNMFAFESYNKGDYTVATYGFMRNSQLGDIGAKNNFAYMIRRKECIYSELYSVKDILVLLRPGLEKGEAFSIVNTALVLCLCLNTESDWKLADKLWDFFSDDESSVYDWWEGLGRSDDPEGFLVHLFLLRHGIISESSLGEQSLLWQKVRGAYPDAPIWLGSNCGDTDKHSSLDDFIAIHFGEEGLVSELSQYLNELPLTRESADEIINATDNYDLYELYSALFNRFKILLTENEFVSLKKKYEEKFSIPFSFMGGEGG